MFSLQVRLYFLFDADFLKKLAFGAFVRVLSAKCNFHDVLLASHAKKLASGGRTCQLRAQVGKRGCLGQQSRKRTSQRFVFVSKSQGLLLGRTLLCYCYGRTSTTFV